MNYIDSLTENFNGLAQIWEFHEDIMYKKQVLQLWIYDFTNVTFSM